MTEDPDQYAGVILVDAVRSADLADVGLPGHMAAVGVDGDGDEYFAIVDVERLGRSGHAIDVSCADVSHEQLGRLPLEFVRRLTVAARTHRCGRPTQAGWPCRIRVSAVGAACGWHRSRVDA